MVCFFDEVEVPEDIACILFRLGSKDISGQCHLGTPSLSCKGTSLKLLPFQPYQKDRKTGLAKACQQKNGPNLKSALTTTLSSAGKYSTELPMSAN